MISMLSMVDWQKQALKKKIDLQFKMKLEDSQREMLHKSGFDDISEKVFS